MVSKMFPYGKSFQISLPDPQANFQATAAMAHLAQRQAFQLQAAFFQWHRARSCADRWALKELRAMAATAGEVTTTGRLVEVEKVKAYLHSVAWALRAEMF